MTAMILLRTIHKDLAKYNASQSEETGEEEFGWKLVHGDVFRPPPQPLLLAVLVGTGVQLALVALLTLGFLSLFNSIPRKVDISSIITDK